MPTIERINSGSSNSIAPSTPNPLRAPMATCSITDSGYTTNCLNNTKGEHLTKLSPITCLTRTYQGERCHNECNNQTNAFYKARYNATQRLKR